MEEVRAATTGSSRTHGDDGALQYDDDRGLPAAPRALRPAHGRYGIRVEPENVLVTSGSQQALDLIGKLLINAGDHVLTEAPTYLGALQAFNAYQADYLPVPIDDDGWTSTRSTSSWRRAEVRLRRSRTFRTPRASR